MLESGGDPLVAHQPLADQLGLAVRRLGRRRGLLGHQFDLRGAVDGGARREHHPVHAGLLHGAEQHPGALDVLRVGVQRLLHRDPRVLEPGEVDDPADVVSGHQIHDRAAVADVAAHERNTGGHELATPARQVVEHDGVDLGLAERAGDVRSDVPGTAGHQPGHSCSLSFSRRRSRAGFRMPPRPVPAPRRLRSRVTRTWKSEQVPDPTEVTGSGFRAVGDQDAGAGGRDHVAFDLGLGKVDVGHPAVQSIPLQPIERHVDVEALERARGDRVDQRVLQRAQGAAGQDDRDAGDGRLERERDVDRPFVMTTTSWPRSARDRRALGRRRARRGSDIQQRSLGRPGSARRCGARWRA